VSNPSEYFTALLGVRMPGFFCQMSEYKGLGNAELWVLARGETGGRTVQPEAAGPEVSPSWYRDPIHGSNVP